MVCRYKCSTLSKSLETWYLFSYVAHRITKFDRHNLIFLRIFQRFRLVKLIEKFKTRVKNLKIEKMITFDKYLHELFFAIYFHLSKNLFLTLKKMKLLIWLTFLQNAAVFKVFKINETVYCRQTFLPISTGNSFFRSLSNLKQMLSIIIQQY